MLYHRTWVDGLIHYTAALQTVRRTCYLACLVACHGRRAVGPFSRVTTAKIYSSLSSTSPALEINRHRLAVAFVRVGAHA